FGLALAPRVFTKCVEAAIAPLRLRGLRVYNYLDDWLIAAHSEAAAVQDGHLVVAHLYHLCVEAAIAQLRLRGLRVYNYLDDWLIAAHSEAAAVQDGHLVVAHLYQLGFVINREKSVLCPRQFTHFLGMILDSTSMEGRLPS